MCDKDFDKSFLACFHICGQYKTQKMSERIICEDPLSIRYVPDQYKTLLYCSCWINLLVIV